MLVTGVGHQMVEHGDGGGDVGVVEAGERVVQTGLAGVLEAAQDGLAVGRDRHLPGAAVKGVRGPFDQVLDSNWLIWRVT